MCIRDRSRWGGRGGDGDETAQTWNVPSSVLHYPSSSGCVSSGAPSACGERRGGPTDVHVRQVVERHWAGRGDRPHAGWSDRDKESARNSSGTYRGGKGQAA